MSGLSSCHPKFVHSHGPRHAHERVRKEIAEACHWLPTDPRLAAIVHGLLNDASAEVRRAMAWQGTNMSEHPELRELFICACDDREPDVAKDALKGMWHLLGVDAAAKFYRHRMAAKPTEDTHWGVYWGICHELDEPAATALMGELAAAPFAEIASSARERLAEA